MQTSEFLVKLLIFFGTISTFLLFLITFFLKRFIDEHDNTKKTVQNLDTRVSVNETQIETLFRK